MPKKVIVALAALMLVAGATTAQSADGPTEPIELYRVLQDGRWGFIDGTGAIVVPPQYDHVFPYRNGFTVVRIGDYRGGRRAFLAADGSRVTDFVFDRAYHFVNGYGTAVRDGKWGFVAPDGSSPGGFVWDAVRDFADGYAAVRLGDRRSGRWGLIDRTGRIVLEPVYLSLRAVGDGVWAAENEDGVALFDPARGAPQAFVYSAVGRFTDGLVPVTQERGTTTFHFILDRRLQIRFQSTDPIRSVAEGVATLRVGDRYQYRDIARGTIVGSPAGYDRAAPFRDGLAVVGRGEDWRSRRYGAIDREGREVVPIEFRRVVPMEGTELIRVLSDRYGFLDRSGRWVVEPRFSATGDFSDGLCPVEVDEQWGYIDTTGSIAIPLEWDAASDFVDGIAVVRAGSRDRGERWYLTTTGEPAIDRPFQWAYTFVGPLAHVAEGDFATGRFGYISRDGTVVWTMQN